jgi:hypothetical protein
MERDVPPVARSAAANEALFAILNDCYDADAHALRFIDAATNPITAASDEADAVTVEKRSLIARLLRRRTTE